MKKMIKKNNGTFKKCFAQRLRELRKENAITQAGLAERMNVSRTCIANWESGERIPEVAAITYLAKLFKVPVDYLCGRTDERYRVKLLDNIDFDLTKLNGKGIEMLCEYYDYLVSSENIEQNSKKCLTFAEKRYIITRLAVNVSNPCPHGVCVGQKSIRRCRKWLKKY